MSFDIDKYQMPIKHDAGYDRKLNKAIDGEISNSFAYQIDDGFSEELDFKNGTLSQADYFIFNKELDVTIIELTRISDMVQEAFVTEKQLEAEIKKLREGLVSSGDKSKETLEKKLNKTIKDFSSKKIWIEVVGEFKNKWMGSVAILERYCRRIGQIEDFNYGRYLIVFPNDMDSRLFESVEAKLRQLQGMGMQVTVCRTVNVDKYI